MHRLMLLLVVCVLLTSLVGSVANTKTSGRTYYAFGDSITQGVTSPDRSYPSQLAKLFTNDTGKQIKVDNLGAGGSTSTDVLKAVKANASKFHNARLITVGVGFNDIGVADYEYNTGHCDAASCYKNALRTFKGNWEAILKTINANCKPGYTTVLFRNNYTRNPDSSYDYYYMTSLNSYLAKAAARYKWPIYDLRSDFDGPSPWTQLLIAPGYPQMEDTLTRRVIG